MILPRNNKQTNKQCLNQWAVVKFGKFCSAPQFCYFFLCLFPAGSRTPPHLVRVLDKDKSIGTHQSELNKEVKKK